MMPGMSHHGVSRKIEDEEERKKMREILDELNPPEDMGFIVRTAGMERSKKDLQADLNYLLRLWQSVEKRLKTARAPAELYQESDLVIRTIRDIYSSEIAQIVCDSERVAVKVAEFLNVVMPRGKNVGGLGQVHQRQQFIGARSDLCRVQTVNLPDKRKRLGTAQSIE
jgi:ribonuclease E